MTEEVRAVMQTEKKYSISLETGRQLTVRLSRVFHRDRYGGRNGYLVRSLYFDSIYDDDYFDKINGLEYRKKIRLRIYDPDQDWAKLEVKEKRGSVQVKKSLTVSRETALQLMAGNDSVLLGLGSGFARQLYQLLERGLYRPKCVVEYRRDAFVEPANNIRITVDTDLRAGKNADSFWKAEPGLHPVLGNPTLEVKYDGFLLDQCKWILGLSGMPELSLSKYELARRAVF